MSFIEDKKRFIFCLLSAVSVVGGGGYAFWRINQNIPEYGDEYENEYTQEEIDNYRKRMKKMLEDLGDKKEDLDFDYDFLDIDNPEPNSYLKL